MVKHNNPGDYAALSDAIMNERLPKVSQRMTVVYQVTIELPNGDWTWRNWATPSFHIACSLGLKMAQDKGGHVISIVKLASDGIRTIEKDPLPVGLGD